MTVLLVLLTLILFLVADYFVQRTRTASAFQHLQQQLPLVMTIPADVRLAYNHTWVRIDKHGDAIIGLDEFLGRLVGSPEEVILPQVDAAVAPEKSSIVLRQGGKKLAVAAPVAGRVVDVNPNARSHPYVTGSDPYGNGWLLKIRPTEPAHGSYLTMGGEKARQWLRQQSDLVKDFFQVRMPSAKFATMQDGGVPATGLLQQFDGQVWKQFEHTFVSLGDREEVSGIPAKEVRS